MFPKIYIGKRNEKHFFLTTNETPRSSGNPTQREKKRKRKNKRGRGAKIEANETSSLLLFLPNLKWGEKGEELERFPTKLRDPLRLVSGF